MAAKSFNYSKWDNIELSDDESDLHPNIDKESWFRMKHRARLEREAKEDEEKKQLQKAIHDEQARLSVILARLSSISGGSAGDDAEFEDVDALNYERDELQQKISNQQKRIEQIDIRRSWNIDNICQVTEEKSVVNTIEPKSLRAEDYKPTGVTEAALIQTKAASSRPADAVPDAPSKVSKPSTATAAAVAVAPPPAPVVGPSMTPNQRDRLQVMSYNDFAVANETILEHYSEISSLDETKEYLFKNCDVLLHEHAQNYLLLSCLEDEMNRKHKRMKLVCRQSQIISHIIELAQSMKRDPREVVIPFFRRLDEKTHLEGFTGAVNDFIEKIKKRAVEKRREMDEEAAAERKANSANGLDPYEVLQSLPAQLKSAFEAQDVPLLQKVLSEMDPVEAKRCMKLCVDSGLWVPQDRTIFDDGHVDAEEEFQDAA